MSAALSLLAALVNESGLPWGVQAEPWQLDDARAVLDEDGPRLHFLTRARGSSKTSDLAAMLVVVLLEQAPPRSRSYAVASDADQGGLLLDALAGYVARSGLGDAIRVEQRRAIVVGSDASLEVLAADGPGSFGLRPYFVVVDELASWASTPNARKVWTGVLSGVPKRPDSRLVVLTSAGDPGHWSYKILGRARVSGMWRVHERLGPTPWMSADDLAEQRALLLPSQYARLHENRWAEPDDRLATRDDVLAAVSAGVTVREPVRGMRYTVGVDLSLTSDYTVVAVAHQDRAAARPFVLDRLRVWKPSKARPIDLSEVESYVAAVAGDYNSARVRIDPYQAMQMVGRLRAARVSIDAVTMSVGGNDARAVGLFRALRDHDLDLLDDDELVDELASLGLREVTPGRYKLDADPGSGGHHDRATALSLALEPFLTRVSGPATIDRPRGTLPTTVAAEAITSASVRGDLAPAARSASGDPRDWRPAAWGRRRSGGQR